ncbi:MAG: YfdX family protein [Chlorobi bacterium]|nr:YfdX family protein [Chlorobiota bacterium]
MKKVLILIAGLLLWGACQQEEAGKSQNQHKMKAEQIHKDVQKPEHTKMTDAEVSAKVSENVRDQVQAEQAEDAEQIKQAIEIIKQTGDAIKLIQEGKIDEAEKLMAKIIGELEILIAKNPELALIPVDVSYETRDLVADIPTVYKLTEAAQEAMDEGYYQLARKILSDLASEIVIKTTNLPLATYPDAMKLAAKLLDEGKNEEALAVLVTALNTLVIIEQNIPLPVLRAEEYIKAAAVVMESDDPDKIEVAINLLENADYQLKLAEALGYGKRDKEYKELAEAIEALKKAIQEKRETKGMFDELKKKIEKFKIRLFFNKENA